MDDDFDLQSRQATWNGFCRLLGYSLAAILVVLALMAVFLT